LRRAAHHEITLSTGSAASSDLHLMHSARSAATLVL